MRPSKTASAEDFTLMSSFEEVRKRLVEEKRVEQLDRPLAYWALTCDRRLPYALLDRNVGELIRMSFGDLAATPGIGRKKIASLLMLLRRALAQKESPSGAEETQSVVPEAVGTSDLFDPSQVSELLWETWRATVRNHDLGQETLGRLAPSLQSLPTVIWNTPLDAYLNLGVTEMRHLKTHGDKRVRAVLEVFHIVHQLIGSVAGHRRLSVRLVPRFVAPLEQWIAEELRNHDAPAVQEIRQNLVLPMLNQIEVDAGDTIHRLAAGRLGVEAPPETVRHQSDRIGVTRARVYQLLDACAQVMAVRWPEGKWQLSVLANKFASLPLKDERSLLFEETRLLMFPDRFQAATCTPEEVRSVG
ncbi:MAG: hypothetical protein ACC628_12815 [Pirellulaceae bacterium]